MYKAGKGVCVRERVCVCVQAVVYAQICIYLYIAHTRSRVRTLALSRTSPFPALLFALALSCCFFHLMREGEGREGGGIKRGAEVLRRCTMIYNVIVIMCMYTCIHFLRVYIMCISGRRTQ